MPALLICLIASGTPSTIYLRLRLTRRSQNPSQSMLRPYQVTRHDRLHTERLHRADGATRCTQGDSCVYMRVKVFEGLPWRIRPCIPKSSFSTHPDPPHTGEKAQSQHLS